MFFDLNLSPDSISFCLSGNDWVSLGNEFIHELNCIMILNLKLFHSYGCKGYSHLQCYTISVVGLLYVTLYPFVEAFSAT